MLSRTPGLADSLDYKLTSFVGGEFLDPTGESVNVVDPATGQPWAKVFADTAHVEQAITAATAAHNETRWARDPAFRSRTLRQVAEYIEDAADELAELEMLGTGKPIAATQAEARYAATWYRYYASAIDTERDDLVALTQTKTAQIRKDPVGIVGAITPFNGGLSLGTWKFAPALAAGNAVVVKPPVVSSTSTLLLATLMTRAGVPNGIFNVVLGDADVGTQLVEDERVRVVTFTGSTAVGELIGAKVASRMGRFICEAGGKSAHIVMDDADLDSAVVAAAQGVFSGSGQTCVAGSRLLVHESVYDEFVQQFTQFSSKITVGNPRDDVNLGPIATEKQRDKVVSLIDSTVDAGAKLLLDGRSVRRDGADERGFWVGPTIISEVPLDAPIWDTEVFGPVVIVRPVKSLEEAITLANSSQFGLAAGIWTRSQATAHEASQRLETGTVWINTYRGMDWRTPFGGYKKSGTGRENGLEALEEFREIKTVVQDVAPAADPFGIR